MNILSAFLGLKLMFSHLTLVSCLCIYQLHLSLAMSFEAKTLGYFTNFDFDTNVLLLSEFSPGQTARSQVFLMSKVILRSGSINNASFFGNIPHWISALFFPFLVCSND